MLSQLEQFAAEIEALKDTWNWIDVRAIAVAEKEVGWLCDYFRAVLMATRPKRVKDLPNVEGLFVRQEVLPVDQFGKLLEMVSSGDILMGPEVVHIRQGGPGQFQPVASYNPRWFERQAALTQFGIDFKTFALQTWASLTVSNDRYRRLELLNGRLQNNDPPWDGLPHVRSAFLKVDANAAVRQDAAAADILAPIFLRLGPQTSVRGSRCTIELEFEKTLKAEHIAAAIFGFEDTTIGHSQRITFSRGNGKISKSVVLPKRFNPVRCVVTFNGIPAEVRDLYQDLAKVPGARWAAFRAIVGPPKDLEEALAEKSSDPLEHAVATLLHLMGVSVVHYGRNTFPRGGDMADIVGFNEDGSAILLIECTSRAVDPGSEIAKLATRAREIQNRVSNATVQPVFWTQQSRGELIEPALDVAIRERVAIVTLGDLEGLLGLAARAPSANRAMQTLTALVPQKSTF